jgi:hypothetical protein
MIAKTSFGAWRALVPSGCISLALLSLTAMAQAQTDPVVLTFATVGDSRLDPAKDDGTQKPLSAQDFQWLQNSKAWSRIMREIGAKKPSLLLFNGDMIMGYGNASLPAALPATVTDYMNTDLARYYTQSAFWRGMVAPLIEGGTYVVPVPGNHETQCRNGKITVPAGLTAGVAAGTIWANISCTDIAGAVHSPTDTQAKLAMQVNEDAWRANFGDLIVDTGRLNAVLPGGNTVANVTGTTTSTAPGTADSLTTDQSKLSYSFDVGSSHFVVINTDPAGADTTAPNVWLQADLAAALGRGAQHYFVFGHKPAFTYDYPANAGAKNSGLDANVANRDAFWNIIENFGATYFCGHEHIYNIAQPVKTDGSTSTAYQVLVGSGGSGFDNSAALNGTQPVTDRYYAWANVKVFASGKVEIDGYGFSDTYGPTKLLNIVTLAH